MKYPKSKSKSLQSKYARFITFLFTLSTMFQILTANIHAAGDLDIDWGVPVPDPVFTVSGMLPGDMDSKDIIVENTADVSRVVAIKGVKTSETNNFAQILDIVISEGGSDLYGGTAGAKTLQEFFDDSMAENGVILGPIDPLETKTYTIKITFPTFAGNEYQNAEVVFNILIGMSIADHIVINEVYYDVDEDHGFDSPKDRGIVDVGRRDVTIIIEDNGAGSINTASVSIRDFCEVVQENDADVRNAVEIYNNTGGNEANGNTDSSVSIFTGISRTFVSIINFFGGNIGSCNSRKLRQNHEWVELYNPTDETVNLRNWVLIDNSGEKSRIRRRIRLDPGEFAIVTANNSTWRHWDEDRDAEKVRLGSQIGDGLDDEGDHLLLVNPDGETVDAVGWEGDSNVWTSDQPGADEGNSIERLSPGFDTDSPLDWLENILPSPGY